MWGWLSRVLFRYAFFIGDPNILSFCHVRYDEHDVTCLHLTYLFFVLTHSLTDSHTISHPTNHHQRLSFSQLNNNPVTETQSGPSIFVTERFSSQGERDNKRRQVEAHHCLSPTGFSLNTVAQRQHGNSSHSLPCPYPSTFSSFLFTHVATTHTHATLFSLNTLPLIFLSTLPFSSCNAIHKPLLVV